MKLALSAPPSVPPDMFCLVSSLLIWKKSSCFLHICSITTDCGRSFSRSLISYSDIKIFV